MYKWIITVNGKDYVVNASNEETAISRSIKLYKKSNPSASRMNPDIQKTVRKEGSTFTDILAHTPNYIVSVRKMGTIYKGGVLK